MPRLRTALLVTSTVLQVQARAMHRQATSSTCILEDRAARTRRQASHTKCRLASTPQLLLSTLMQVDLRSDRRNTVDCTAMLPSTPRRTMSGTGMPRATLQPTEARGSTQPKSPTLSKNTSTRSKPPRLRSPMRPEVPELLKMPMRAQVGLGETVTGPARLIRHPSVLRQLAKAEAMPQDHRPFTVGEADTRAQPTRTVTMVHTVRSESHTTPQVTMALQAATKTLTTRAQPRPQSMQPGLTAPNTWEGQTLAGQLQGVSVTITTPWSMLRAAI